MRMIVTLRVEDDESAVARESVSSVGVDTRIEGLDPDAAKEDFMAQARGLLASLGETHIPALYASVKDALDAAADDRGEDHETPGIAQVRDRMRKLRERRDAAADDSGQEAEA